MDKSRLPTVQDKKNHFFGKLKMKVLIALTAIGIFSPRTDAFASYPPNYNENNVKENESDIDIEDEYKKALEGLNVAIESDSKADFVSSLTEQVNTKEQEENKIIKRLTKIAEDKKFSSEVLNLMINTYEDIEKNYDKNNLLENNNITKDEYIERYISNIEKNVDKITLLEAHEKEEEKTEVEKQMNSIYAAGCCFSDGIYIIKNDRYTQNTINSIFIHELKHAEQNFSNKERSVLVRSLTEGSASFANFKMNDYEIENRRFCDYSLEGNIYKKFVYLLGEEVMNDFIVGNTKDNFEKIATSSIDAKYGKGMGEKIYKNLNDLSYNKLNREKEIPNSKRSIEHLKDILASKSYRLMQNHGKDILIEGTDEVFISKETIERLKRDIEQKENVLKILSKSQKDVAVDAENAVLECILIDAKNVSSKDEAKAMLKKWDVYRDSTLYTNRGTSRKSIKDEDYSGMSVADIEDVLYEKCIEYDALNIKNRQLFDLVIKSELYDIQNVNISYEDDIICIADGFIINRIDANDMSFINTETEEMEDKRIIESYDYVPLFKDGSVIEKKEENVEYRKQKDEEDKINKQLLADGKTQIDAKNKIEEYEII